MKKLLYNGLWLVLVSSYMCAAVSARAQGPAARIAGLEGNEEYMTLLYDNEILQQKEDSVLNLINSARERFADRTENRNEFANYIVDLEEKVFEIRTAKGVIAGRINTIEQEWVLSRLSGSIPSSDEMEDRPESRREPRIAVRRNIADNDCIRRELSDEDYADLRRAHLYEQSIMGDIDSLEKTYMRLRSAVSAYDDATDELMADSIYTDCMRLGERVDSLSGIIADKWSHIVDAKSFAYGFVLEKYGHIDVLNDVESQFSDMRQRYAAVEGRYVSDPLSHYVIGKPVMSDYERRFAEAMSLDIAADSVAEAVGKIPSYDYRLDRLDVKRRLFLDYQPVAFGRTTYYNSRNPLPLLKVYDEGTIYRILLGSFKTRQQMTLFKGVYPLYISQNDDNMYCYYAGGYATRAEADEARQQLSDKGFRAPQVCRWVDGEMTNLTLEEKNDDNAALVSGMRYVVEIVSETPLSDGVREIIAANGRNREISRTGDNMFVVGTYADRGAAEDLVRLISEFDPSLDVKVSEIVVE